MRDLAGALAPNLHFLVEQEDGRVLGQQAGELDDALEHRGGFQLSNLFGRLAKAAFGLEFDLLNFDPADAATGSVSRASSSSRNGRHQAAPEGSW